ncbi:MAG: hypothetical protein OEY85_05910, partial [Rhodospirillales bacterium]|nr:hypothetical protein [Rhodospirillales bacterium]
MNTFDSGQYSKTSFNDSRETNSEMSVATSEDAAPETIVEIAQTAAALRVGPLGAGQAQTVPVNPGQQIVITGLNAGATQQAFRQDGGS